MRHAACVMKSIAILDLDNVQDVRLAASWPGQVYWVTSRVPAEVAGSLVEGDTAFQGAWWENFRLLVQVDGSMRVFEVLPSLAGSPTVARKVVKWSLAGHSIEWVQTRLDSLASGISTH